MQLTGVLVYFFFFRIESRLHVHYSVTKCTNSKGLYTDLLPHRRPCPTSAKKKAYTHSIPVINKGLLTDLKV